MDNAISNVGDSMPFDMGDMGNMPAAQDSMPAAMNQNSVRMFSPDDLDDVSNAQPPIAASAADPGPAATQATAPATQGGNAAPQAGGKGADMSGMMSQIMNMVQSAISAATPLLGMFSSLIGGLGGLAGKGTGGTGAA
jgi:hypothetical protein